MLLASGFPLSLGFFDFFSRAFSYAIQTALSKSSSFRVSPRVGLVSAFTEAELHSHTTEEFSRIYSKGHVVVLARLRWSVGAVRTTAANPSSLSEFWGREGDEWGGNEESGDGGSSVGSLTPSFSSPPSFSFWLSPSSLSCSPPCTPSSLRPCPRSCSPPSASRLFYIFYLILPMTL